MKQAKQGGIDLLFLGDSITAGWLWDKGGLNVWNKYYAPRHAAEFGIGYDRIQNVLWRTRHGELDGIKPKVVMLLIGTNNAGNEDNGKPRTTTSEIIEGVTAAVRELRARLPESKILLFGIFPRGGTNDPVREQVVALRQRNLSVYDIQRELAAGRHPIGINALTILLGEAGFARLPRRRSEERPASLKADSAGVADVRRPDPRLRVRSGCRRARFAPPSPARTFRTPRVFD